MADSLRPLCAGLLGFVDAAGRKQHLVAIGRRTGRNLEWRVQTVSSRSGSAGERQVNGSPSRNPLHDRQQGG